MAGAVAALTLWMMQQLSGLIWSGSDSRWYIVTVILGGGVLLALLRLIYAGEGLAAQLAEDVPQTRKQVSHIAVLIAMAVVAVAFGGSIGPEAGLLAVVTELGALVSLLLARNAQERHYISDVGAAAALGGLYGSPLGGAATAEQGEAAPRWQLYLAATAGLVGFLLTTKFALHGEGMRVHLPPHISAMDGTDFFAALPAAVLGAAVGVAFVKLLPWLEQMLAKTGGIVVQTMVGTLLFAALAATLPILRFSGHAELEDLVHWGETIGAPALLLLAGLKIVATALCLSAGWRGGAAFPLLFAGAAAGGALLGLFPQIPVTVMLVGGMTAALTVGMGKPLAGALIALLLIGPVSVGAMAAGAMVGWAAAQRWPSSAVH